MVSGIVSLEPLYEFSHTDPAGKGFEGRSAPGKEYGKLAKAATQDVALKQGFYLWGAYGSNGLWSNVYLGRASSGKTANLRSRIAEELKNERAAVYVDTIPAVALDRLGKRFYPEKWDGYYSGFVRALKKGGSTHIVWVAMPKLVNKEVHEIEADLIESLNPVGNIVRPAPPAELQDETRDIIGKFRELIHENRSDRFPLRHARLD